MKERITLKTRPRWVDNMKFYLKDIGWVAMGWVHLA